MDEMMRIVEGKFHSNYTIEPNSGCWLWTGSCIQSSKGGDVRPKITVGRKGFSAYRVAYQLLVGPIPDGKMICHKCNVSICVNPDHLYAGTAKDNARDAVVAGTQTLLDKGHQREMMERSHKAMAVNAVARLPERIARILPISLGKGKRAQFARRHLVLMKQKHPQAHQMIEDHRALLTRARAQGGDA